MLSTSDHDRGAAGLTYVYPVVSRRAGGVSVGLNLNPDKTCNWRCVYCQVPGLVAGRGPAVDLELFERELRWMLGELIDGDYMRREVPEGYRRIRDLAFSGDGEPTSSPSLGEVLERVAQVRAERGLGPEVATVLITNGSLLHQTPVQRAVARLAELSGAVWYKLDSATAEGQVAINSNRAGPARALANLRTCARLCPTWIQTCLFTRGGRAPAEGELEAFAAALGELVAEGLGLRGVLLYSLARPSLQPEAPELGPLPKEALGAWARRIEELGLEVRLSP